MQIHTFIIIIIIWNNKLFLRVDLMWLCCVDHLRWARLLWTEYEIVLLAICKVFSLFGSVHTATFNHPLNRAVLFLVNSFFFASLVYLKRNLFCIFLIFIGGFYVGNHHDDVSPMQMTATNNSNTMNIVNTHNTTVSLVVVCFIAFSIVSKSGWQNMRFSKEKKNNKKIL